MPNLLTKTEAAALLEVTTPALDRALKAGRISYHDPARRLFDRGPLLLMWQNNRQRRRKPVPASADPATTDPNAPPTEAELRRRLLQAQVATAERQAGAEDGERIALVALGRCLRGWYQVGITVVSGVGGRFEAVMLPRIREDARAGMRAELVGIERELLNQLWGVLLQALAREAPEFAAQMAAGRASSDPK